MLSSAHKLYAHTSCIDAKSHTIHPYCCKLHRHKFFHPAFQLLWTCSAFLKMQKLRTWIGCCMALSDKIDHIWTKHDGRLDPNSVSMSASHSAKSTNQPHGMSLHVCPISAVPGSGQETLEIGPWMVHKCVRCDHSANRSPAKSNNNRSWHIHHWNKAIGLGRIAAFWQSTRRINFLFSSSISRQLSLSHPAGKHTTDFPNSVLCNWIFLHWLCYQHCFTDYVISAASLIMLSALLHWLCYQHCFPMWHFKIQKGTEVRMTIDMSTTIITETSHPLYLTNKFSLEWAAHKLRYGNKWTSLVNSSKRFHWDSSTIVSHLQLCLQLV